MPNSDRGGAIIPFGLDAWQTLHPQSAWCSMGIETRAVSSLHVGIIREGGTAFAPRVPAGDGNPGSTSNAARRLVVQSSFWWCQSVKLRGPLIRTWPMPSTMTAPSAAPGLKPKAYSSQKPQSLPSPVVTRLPSPRCATTDPASTEHDWRASTPHVTKFPHALQANHHISSHPPTSPSPSASVTKENKRHYDCWS